MKINLLLAFDHELPLGGISKTFEDAIFKPTDTLLDLAKQLNVPVNIFTDVLSAIRMKELGHEDYYIPYIHQLERALHEKHDVQLHLHPHWLETDYENGVFVHSGKFSLADYKDNHAVGRIDDIVSKGIDFLNTICKPSDNNYKCIAYRAGGFNLAPETRAILNALYKYGIRIESSINPGFYYKTRFVSVDYSSMPDLSHWYFSPDGPVDKITDQGMMEITIAGKPAGLITNLNHVIRKKQFKSRRYSAGSAIHEGKMSPVDKLRFVFSNRLLGFDVYTLSSDNLMDILKYNIGKYQNREALPGGREEIVLSTLSHPKNMGRYGFLIMKEFIEKARLYYKDKITFTTYQAMYKHFFEDKQP
ncbi:MAG: hypothetical protein HY840_13500 [Bacteroidetes bacterium]|nr:hypothetical protein [Bacteroidota bacterium]